MLRRFAAAAALAVSAGVVAACEPGTVSIRFDPEVGDRYRFRSEISTDIERTIEGETTTEQSESVLDAVEEVLSVDGAEIRLAVTLERDRATPRRYEVLVDRGDRLSAIDLVEGVPADALGLDLATDLPSDIASPPPEPLEPGQTWEIRREVPLTDDTTDRGSETVTVTGHGRVRSLGVEDGNDVATVEVELRVPIRSTIDTIDGVVTARGVQTSTSRTTYDLSDGAARRDRTVIDGTVDVVVDPPEGVLAPPVRGELRYAVATDTRRVPQQD